MAAHDLNEAANHLNGFAAKAHHATPGGAFYAGIFSAGALFDMMNEGIPAAIVTEIARLNPTG